MKQISVTEYAKLQGITRQAVLKRIKKNKPMPGVNKVVMVGKTYVLEID